MSEPKNIFTEEEIKSIASLGDALRRIHDRLLKEGIIKIGEDGKVIFPEIKNK